MQCANKLKQLALATHTYHDTNDRLVSVFGETLHPRITPDIPVYAALMAAPEATRTGYINNLTTDWWSGLVFLLPFVEQTSLFEQYDSTTYNARKDRVMTGAFGTVTADPRYKFVDVFICPSDSNALQVTTAPTNYRFCAGDSPVTVPNSGCSATGPTLVETTVIRDWDRGSFGYRSRYNFGEIIDGTSNTLFFSERAVGATANGVVRVEEGVINTTTLSTADTILTSETGTAAVPDFSLADRSAIIALADKKNYKNPLTGYTFPTNYQGNNGWVFSDGAFWQSTFHTVVPPNGPSWRLSVAAAYIGVYTPSSNHTGGVNAAFGDGSVRFVSETIEVGSENAANRGSGASNFGVWGALGSRDGGEAKGL
jgi:prepilin-type processing-associated H-X9-DG protein